MASPKKKYDWESIEKDFRAGILSIRELSRKHDCPEASIRYKAKKHEWKRDLTDKVRKLAQEKLLRANLRKSNINEEEVINEKSDDLVQIQLLQRNDIANLRELEKSLIDEIKGKPTRLWVGQYQGKVITKQVGLTAAERAMAANNLANVQHKRIQLERQAYSIDGDPGSGIDPIGQLLKNISERNKPIVTDDNE
jgi:hypothetical protein